MRRLKHLGCFHALLCCFRKHHDINGLYGIKRATTFASFDAFPFVHTGMAFASNACRNALEKQGGGRRKFFAIDIPDRAFHGLSGMQIALSRQLIRHVSSVTMRGTIHLSLAPRR